MQTDCHVSWCTVCISIFLTSAHMHFIEIKNNYNISSSKTTVENKQKLRKNHRSEVSTTNWQLFVNLCFRVHNVARPTRCNLPPPIIHFIVDLGSHTMNTTNRLSQRLCEHNVIHNLPSHCAIKYNSCDGPDDICQRSESFTEYRENVANTRKNLHCLQINTSIQVIS